MTQQLNFLSATTPFLKGVPNSLVSPEWYRLLTALISTEKDTQVIQEAADDTTGNDPDAMAGIAALQGQVADLYSPEGNEADAQARAQQAADLTDPMAGVEQGDATPLASQAADLAIEQLLQDGMDRIAEAMAALQDAIVEQATLVDVIRSMASQDAGNVAITGGSIDGTAVGANTASTGAFTTLAASGAFGCNGSTPQTKATFNAASTDLASVIALCNQIRAALIANGIGQ